MKDDVKPERMEERFKTPAGCGSIPTRMTGATHRDAIACSVRHGNNQNVPTALARYSMSGENIYSSGLSFTSTVFLPQRHAATLSEAGRSFSCLDKAIHRSPLLRP